MKKNQCVSEKLNGKQKLSFLTKEGAEAYLGPALKYSSVYLCDNGGCGKWHTSSSSGTRSKKADPNSNRQRKRRERRNKRKAG